MYKHILCTYHIHVYIYIYIYTYIYYVDPHTRHRGEAGQSRSPSVVAAYLMRKERADFYVLSVWGLFLFLYSNLVILLFLCISLCTVQGFDYNFYVLYRAYRCFYVLMRTVRADFYVSGNVSHQTHKHPST